MKVNITPSSKPANISQINPPAYPNLTDINTVIKGTMQELLKGISHQAEPQPAVTNQTNNTSSMKNTF